jgi:hypothetical protein
MRILLTRTIQPLGAKSAEPEGRQVEVRVLAGVVQLRSDFSLRERVGKGCKLDRFGSRPDREPDIDAVQPSP